MNRRDAGHSEPDAELNRVSGEVIGAAIEVHRALGPGFLESIYEEAMCDELQLRRLPFARQVAIAIPYKGRIIAEQRLDLLVADRLIVELKAVEALAAIHTAQLLSYLKATRLVLGLLINFNVHQLVTGVRRVIQTP